MNTLFAFSLADKARKDNKPEMVFDWEKAANLILKYRPKIASAGLSQDWENTGGIIYQNKQIVINTYTYLASIWAEPELDMDDKIYPCWRYDNEVSEWNYDTKWPKEAIDILSCSQQL